MFRVLCAGVFAIALLGGCEKKTAPTEFKGKNDDHDHEHDRKDAMLEDIELPDGTKCHAGLTAHLTTEPGKNELDLFFETTKDPKPVPISLKAEVTGQVTREGDDMAHTLAFQPAEKDERKGDPDGKCSRFSADAGWMKPDDKLVVVLTVKQDGKIKKVTFTNFVPKEKSHQHK